MPDRSLRSRLVGGFGGAGGTLVIAPILEMLLGLEWPLELLLAFESVGIVSISIAILLHMTDKERKRNQ